MRAPSVDGSSALICAPRRSFGAVPVMLFWVAIRRCKIDDGRRDARCRADLAHPESFWNVSAKSVVVEGEWAGSREIFHLSSMNGFRGGDGSISSTPPRVRLLAINVRLPSDNVRMSTCCTPFCPPCSLDSDVSSRMSSTISGSCTGCCSN